MRSRILSVTVVAGALAFGGCSVVKREALRDDARTVVQALRADEQAYQKALAADERAISRVRLWADASAAPPVEEIESAQAQLATLKRRLESLPVRPEHRQALIGPILDQLDREARSLAEMQAAVRDGGDVRALLERHHELRNLFVPAIKKLREDYRVVKQKLWRGRPLTA